MSKNSSHHKADQNSLAALTALLAGAGGDIERDYEEEAVQRLINHARSLLAEAVTLDGIKPSELSARLGVHRSLVTRFFRSHSDIKVSTLAVMARALGREWVFCLEKQDTNYCTNYPPNVDATPDWQMTALSEICSEDAPVGLIAADSWELVPA